MTRTNDLDERMYEASLRSRKHGKTPRTVHLGPSAPRAGARVALAALLGVAASAPAWAQEAAPAPGAAPPTDAGVLPGGAPPKEATGGPSPADAALRPGAEAVPPAPPLERLSLPRPAPVPPRAPEAVRVEALTVVGTRESRTAGSAHVLRAKDLERLNQDNPESVVKSVPGVYTRPEDGVGLRPNIGIRGTSPERSKKLTLMEDGVLFGPAPYAAPAAYYFPLITRMEGVRVIKGPGAVSFGPQTVGGAIDLVTRRIPNAESGGLDLAVGQFGYGKAHGHFGASTERAGFVIEGVHLRADGFKELDGGGDTGFSRNEWMWKGRYRLSTDAAAPQELGLKLGFSDEDSNETYLGLTDADFRKNPLRRYRASRLDRMKWQRTQIVGTYRAELRQALSFDVTAYRHGLDRSWRKLNQIGNASLYEVLTDPTGRNQPLYDVLRGEKDSAGVAETLWIGPNHRSFVSQGVQATATWRGLTGPVAHRLELGARYHYDRVDRLHQQDAFLMRGGRLVAAGAPTETTAHERAWAKALALHVADAVTWRRLTLTPGLRIEIIGTRERDRKAGVEREGATQRVLIPGLGAFLELTPNLGVLAGAYRGFSPAAPAQPAAVEPEKSVNYEVGARLRTRAVRLEAIGFFNDYDNLTSVCAQATGCAADRLDTQYQAGRARIWGAELFGQADLALGAGFAVPLTAAYTFTRTELLETFRSEDPTFGEVTAGDELPYVPRHQASAAVALEHARGALVLGGTYVSAMREAAGQGDEAREPRTDASLLIDVTLRMPVLARRADLYLNVRNLLGADDIVSRRPYGARPVAPRWVQLGARFAF